MSDKLMLVQKDIPTGQIYGAGMNAVFEFRVAIEKMLEDALQRGIRSGLFNISNKADGKYDELLDQVAENIAERVKRFSMPNWTIEKEPKPPGTA